MIITPPKYDYAVDEVIRVVDADTFDLTVGWEVDHGFYLKERKRWTTRFRLYGFDAVESSSETGHIATAFVIQWFEERKGLVRVATHKPDNFGRWLADVYSFDGYLKDALLDAGFQKVGSKWNI